ncbi:DUF2515 family protein [Bacillus sp. CGMCC 1.16541]|uniref:DUF2515 family protein n=1 Tax=Bacillus sp. CGMCC 1.16541 TaxID=2185143 RepID=UPI000D727992|nr:DUF2515 family protein [Bacillus sp. CGMCC 1.16541]
MKESGTMNELSFEKRLLHYIKYKREKMNIDNVSRTIAYADYYRYYPEIQWSFLASMVSRNAGWNMCDLEGKWMPRLLRKQTRDILFLTYERANWLIFHDVYPQLLIYAVSKAKQKSYFYLLPYFGVSSFIREEWQRFWEKGDQERLRTSLIINEQNIIQQPVIEHPFYQEKVFRSFIFTFQDFLHFSCVLFPTLEGQLYGCSVHDFWKKSKRIELGKKLAKLLFHPAHHEEFLQFSNQTIHTGSRYDYEQYLKEDVERHTPILRTTFPLVSHHQSKDNHWQESRRKIRVWQKDVSLPPKINVTKWYRKKQVELHLLIKLQSYVHHPLQ